MSARDDYPAYDDYAEMCDELDELTAELVALRLRVQQAEEDADSLFSLLSEKVLPVGAYVRWRKDGNTADADLLDAYTAAWDKARAAHVDAVAQRPHAEHGNPTLGVGTVTPSGDDLRAVSKAHAADKLMSMTSHLALKEAAIVLDWLAVRASREEQT